MHRMKKVYDVNEPKHLREKTSIHSVKVNNYLKVSGTYGELKYLYLVDDSDPEGCNEAQNMAECDALFGDSLSCYKRRGFLYQSEVGEVVE